MALGLCAVVLLAGCASTQIRTDYDRQASFEGLRTYRWIDREHGVGGHPALESPLLGRRIQDAVDGELARLGYRKVASGRPDFRVAYRVIAQEETIDDVGYGSHYGHHHSGHFGHFGHLGHLGHGPYYDSGLTYDRLRGTLVLDIFDARRKLIWRGWAERTLAHNPKPASVEKYVRKAARKILAEFPPSTGKPPDGERPAVPLTASLPSAGAEN